MYHYIELIIIVLSIALNFSCVLKYSNIDLLFSNKDLETFKFNNRHIFSSCSLAKTGKNSSGY